MEYILASLNMFSGIAENLINYSFNVGFSQKVRICVLLLTPFQMSSYEMNVVMYVSHLITDSHVLTVSILQAQAHPCHHHHAPNDCAHWLFRKLSLILLQKTMKYVRKKGMNFNIFWSVQQHSDALYAYISSF